MKKKYEKPGIYVENFALSQSIATACGASREDSSLGYPLYSDKFTCGWQVGGLAVWTENVETCIKKWDPDAGFHGVCYNNPTAATTIFSAS